MNCTFEQYLLSVGMRAEESFVWEEMELIDELEHFRDCHKRDISPYTALVLLIKDEDYE